MTEHTITMTSDQALKGWQQYEAAMETAFELAIKGDANASTFLQWAAERRAGLQAREIFDPPHEPSFAEMLADLEATGQGDSKKAEACRYFIDQERRAAAGQTDLRFPIWK
jgi:hypothetical protein